MLRYPTYRSREHEGYFSSSIKWLFWLNWWDIQTEGKPFPARASMLKYPTASFQILFSWDLPPPILFSDMSRYTCLPPQLLVSRRGNKYQTKLFPSFLSELNVGKKVASHISCHKFIRFFSLLRFFILFLFFCANQCFILSFWKVILKNYWSITTFHNFAFWFYKKAKLSSYKKKN